MDSWELGILKIAVINLVKWAIIYCLLTWEAISIFFGSNHKHVEAVHSRLPRIWNVECILYSILNRIQLIGPYHHLSVWESTISVRFHSASDPFGRSKITEHYFHHFIHWHFGIPLFPPFLLSAVRRLPPLCFVVFVIVKVIFIINFSKIWSHSVHQGVCVLLFRIALSFKMRNKIRRMNIMFAVNEIIDSIRLIGSDHSI